ncbi:MAG: UDP-N-acetylmuramate dehydrogenase, partial [Paludibacteraceae bacterium]|nr:UDP-N-acetylmuramate dehydrogenase [Paludibacteraceae bacterium]
MKTFENYSLLNNNTFGVDVKANYFIEYDSVEELQSLLRSDLLQESKFMHIGGGSNLLFINDYQGVILHSQIKGIDAVEGTRSKVVLRAGAGERWDDFVEYCVSKNYGGVENLSGIPGEVGATPIQNIGAYGAEVRNSIVAVECVNAKTGEERIFTAKECQFGYRDSIFKRELKGKYIVTYVHYQLCKTGWTPNVDYGSLKTEIPDAEHATLKDVRNAVLAIRGRKLPEPKVLGNAGSFFMNPVVPTEQYNKLKEQFPDMPCYVVSDNEVKVPAGWLIEQCGWKGKSVGRVAVHGSQALVLINKGGANGLDIINLSDSIRASVRDKFGIDLTPEV